MLFRSVRFLVVLFQSIDELIEVWYFYVSKKFITVSIWVLLQIALLGLMWFVLRSLFKWVKLVSNWLYTMCKVTRVKPIPAPVKLSDKDQQILDLQSEMILLKRLVSQQPFATTKVVKEMAIPYNLPKTQGDTVTNVKGVVSIRSEDGHIIGMGYRGSIKGFDCLVTAGHVFDIIRRLGNARPFIEHKGSQQNLCHEKWEVVAYSPPESLDFACIKDPGNIFSTLGVSQLKITPFIDHMSITIWGYQDGKLCVSTAAVEADEKHPFKFTHHAPTAKGYSGSPLLSNGKVVGIHTGAAEHLARNTGVEFFKLFEENIKEGNPYGENKRGRRRQWDDIDRKDYLEEQREIVDILDERYDIQYSGGDFAISAPKRNKANDDWANWKPTSGRLWSDSIPGETIDYETSAWVNESGFRTGSEEPVKPVRKPLVKTTSTSTVQPKRNRGRKRTNSAESLTPTLKGSTNSANTTGKKGPLPKKVLDSKPLDIARVERLEAGIDNLTKRLSTLVPKDQLLESGIILNAAEKENESHSSSKPVDTKVLVVHLTRKQDKHLNRIYQSREFQKVLSKLTPQESHELRLKALNFVKSPALALKGNPDPDFLSTL